MPNSVGGATGSTLYDRAVALLRQRYFDRAFRESALLRLAEEYRPAEAVAADVGSQRAAVTRLLSHIPASHLSVLSQESLDHLLAELMGQRRPTIGLQALRIGDDYFTFFVLEGGPAAEKGVLAWERIVSING